MFLITVQWELWVLSSPPTHLKRMLVWWMCAWDSFIQQKLFQEYVLICLDLQQMVLQLVSSTWKKDQDVHYSLFGLQNYL